MLVFEVSRGSQAWGRLSVTLLSLIQFRHPLSPVLVGGVLLLDHRWKLSFRLLSVAHCGAFALKNIGANCSIQVKFCFEAGKCNYSGYFHKNVQILQFCIIVAVFRGLVNKPVLMAGKVFCASTIKASVWIKYSV